MGSARESTGFSLVEVLVALALVAVVAPIAFECYATTRRLFKAGDDLVELQESIRAGHDAMLRDVSRAGLNADPDGDPARPDETLEAAFETALIFRADLDGGTPEALDPESQLAGGGPFGTVSTGNDEIVGFVLARADAPNPGTLVFHGDVLPVPRDGAVEAITVTNVALVHDDPPYTLYRFTVKHGAKTTLRVPVIDGVRSLRLTYYDLAGQPVVAPGGGETPELRAARSAIRGVRIEIVGMGRDPETPWAAPGGRAEFALIGQARLRNAGPVLLEGPATSNGGP